MSKTHFTLEESDEEICTINTLSKLLKKIIDGGDKRIYLRGLSDFKDDLIPSIGREHHFIGKTVTFDNHHEKQLLSRVRRQAYAQWNRVPNEWESIILARHHGLPNRLLAFERPS